VGRGCDIDGGSDVVPVIVVSGAWSACSKAQGSIRGPSGNDNTLGKSSSGGSGEVGGESGTAAGWLVDEGPDRM
jgi:hypothetical protein